MLISSGGAEGGLLVGTEGADTATRRDALRDSGCDIATGALYGQFEPVDLIE